MIKYFRINNSERVIENILFKSKSKDKNDLSLKIRRNKLTTALEGRQIILYGNEIRK